MNDEQLLGLELPKWPGLLVSGPSITAEQADEVLIRTDDLYFHGNSRHLDQEFNQLFGIAVGDYGSDFKSVGAARIRFRSIELEYLTNRRIYSSFIYGPHGWCDWNGDLRANSFNIGKWPSMDEVYGEWGRIAAAFPWLRLTSQLLDKEIGEDGAQPVVQFEIGDGAARILSPGPLLLPSEIRERGVSSERLRRAISRLQPPATHGPAAE